MLLELFLDLTFEFCCLLKTNVFGNVPMSTLLCLHQGNDGKVLALEKKLAELKAENKSYSVILKQIIQTLCAEEVVSFR